MAAVYFIQAGYQGPVKIGFTAGSIEGRIRLFQTAHFAKLRLVLALYYTNYEDARRAERFLHRLFAADRLHGEWFRPSDYVWHWICERLPFGEDHWNLPEEELQPSLGFDLAMALSAGDDWHFAEIRCLVGDDGRLR